MFSFKLFGTGDAYVEYHFHFITTLLREFTVWNVFYFGPWLFGAVVIDTPLHPNQYPVSFAIFILSGIIVQSIFLTIYSLKRYRSIRFRLAAICFSFVAIIIGSLHDLRTAYFYLNYKLIFYFFIIVEDLVLILFYSGILILIWPYLFKLYNSIKNEVKKIE